MERRARKAIPRKRRRYRPLLLQDVTSRVARTVSRGNVGDASYLDLYRDLARIVTMTEHLLLVKSMEGREAKQWADGALAAIEAAYFEDRRQR